MNRASQPSGSAASKRSAVSMSRLSSRTATVSVNSGSRVDNGEAVSAASSCRRRMSAFSSASRSNGSRRQAPGEVAPLGQLARGIADAVHRTVFGAARRSLRPHAAPQRPAQSLRRIFQLLVQATTGTLRRTAARARLGEHLEQRIDARFDRTLAQQVGTEAVNGADVGLLEPLNRVGEVLLHVRLGSALPQAFQLLADSQLQLAGRLLGERDRHHLLDRARPSRARAGCAARARWSCPCRPPPPRRWCRRARCGSGRGPPDREEAASMLMASSAGRSGRPSAPAPSC